MQKELLLKMSFDQNPTITLLRAFVRRQEQVFKNGLLELEEYSVPNHYDYPLGFTYYFGRPLVNIMRKNGAAIQGKVDKYEILGAHEVIDLGNQSVSFTIPPKQSIVIRGYVTEPTDAIESHAVNLYELNPPNYPYTLSLFHDFSFSVKDKSGVNLIGPAFGQLEHF